MVKKSLIQLKLLVKAILGHALSFINNNPKFRRYVLVIVNHLGLQNAARAFYVFMVNSANKSNASRMTSFVPKDIEQLSPQASNVYVNLKSAIQSQKKEKTNQCV